MKTQKSKLKVSFLTHRLGYLGREVNLSNNYDGNFISLKWLVHLVP